jgi:hypothetical protein
MAAKRSFSAVIQNAGGGGAFVEVPFDVEKLFGSKRPKVRATIEGLPYRGSLVRMGGPRHILIVLKGIREKAGKTFGDPVHVTVAEDTAPRIVRVPADLQKAFQADLLAKAAFAKLSYTDRKEYVRWITEARRQETRRDHVKQVVSRLHRGREPR